MEATANGETGSKELDLNGDGNELSSEGETTMKAGALEVTVILQKVLEGLPFKDLLSASLVCKLWCREARSVMKYKRFCILKCYEVGPKGENSCAIIANISKEMEQSTTIDPKMFKGIKIGRCAHADKGVNLYTESGKFLIDNLKDLKYFQAEDRHQGKKRLVCSVHAFAAKLFLKNMETIETLKFYPNSDVIGKIIYQLQDRPSICMPSLKVFCPYGCGDPAYVNVDFISEIIDGPSKLKRIESHMSLNGRGRNDISVRKTLPKIGWQLVRDLSLHSKDGDLYLRTEELAELASYNLHLEQFSPTGLRYNLLNPQDWNSIRTIFDSSQRSLNRVIVSLCVLKALAQPRHAPLLSNVNKLWLTVHPMSEEHEFHEGARVFPLPLIVTVFPEVKNLHIRWAEDCDSDIPDCGCHGNPRMQHRVYQRLDHRFDFRGQNPTLTALRHFTMDQPAISSDSFATMAEGSPNVTSGSLSLYTLENFSNYLPYVWKFWPNLESLELTIFEASEVNLDVALLGIPPEKVKMWQKMDEVSLNALKIVPSKPAITDMKELKKLKIELRVLFNVPQDFEKLRAFFLSKLFVILGLRKMPHLEFILEVREKELGAYLNLIPKELEPYLKKK